MDTTIPEAILLLGLDDETGKAFVSDSTLGTAFAAGAMAQLAMVGRVRIAGAGEEGAKQGTFVAADGPVDARLEPLVKTIVGKSPTDALGRLMGLGGPGSAANKVRKHVLEDFAEVGLLVRQEQRFLGITWSERWERGERREIEDALQARAREILEGRGGSAASAAPIEQDDQVLAAALAILHAVEALPAVFPDLPKEHVTAAGAALAEGDWASGAVREALEQLDSMMTGILVTTVIMPAATGSH